MLGIGERGVGVGCSGVGVGADWSATRPALFRARATRDHVVDESAPEFAAHNVVTVRAGDVVSVVDGTLDRGMSAPYEDYVAVRRADGREGIVSRYCLEAVPSSVRPPPALFAPTAAASSSPAAASSDNPPSSALAPDSSWLDRKEP